ncbi:MAG: hypothetical protein ACE5JN_06500 [Candidatus Methylomirabilia bacterium]
METPSRPITFIVRISPGERGSLSGIAERVRTGERQRFHGAEALGPLIARMVDNEEHHDIARGGQPMDTRGALEIQRQLWSNEGSPGRAGMRMLRDDVCAYDLAIGGGAWFHKTNVGQGNRWSIGEGRGLTSPDIIVYFDESLNYPFCFEQCKTTEELIGAFRTAAQRGLIWFEPKKEMSELVAKGYNKVAETLGLKPKQA